MKIKVYILIVFLLLGSRNSYAQNISNFPEDGSTYSYMIDHRPNVDPIDPMVRDYNLINLLSPCYTSISYKKSASGKTLTRKTKEGNTNYKLYNNKFCIDRYQGKDLHEYSNKVGVKYKNLFCDKVQNLSSNKTTYMGSAITVNYYKVSMYDKIDISTNYDEIILSGRHDKSYAPVGQKSVTMPGWAGEVMMYKVKEEFIFSRAEFLLEGKVVKLMQGEQLKSLFRDILSEEYQFFSTDMDDVILSAHLDNEGSKAIKRVEFLLSLSSENFIECEDTDKKNIYLFPNPTIGDVKILFQNYEPGEYELDIFNTIGKQLSSISITLPPDENQISVSLPKLRKGTYLYAIQNKQGERLVTKRLTIITY